MTEFRRPTRHSSRRYTRLSEMNGPIGANSLDSYVIAAEYEDIGKAVQSGKMEGYEPLLRIVATNQKPNPSDPDLSQLPEIDELFKEKGWRRSIYTASRLNGDRKLAGVGYDKGTKIINIERSAISKNWIVETFYYVEGGLNDKTLYDGPSWQDALIVAQTEASKKD